jgi:hypothetical protein
MARTQRRRLKAVPEIAADPDAKATPPAAMPVNYLECHSTGHWWAFVGDTNLVLGPGRKRKPVAFTRRYACQRCGETKKVTRGIDFRIETATYTQPPGYRMDRADTSTSTRYTAMAELLRREGNKWI